MQLQVSVDEADVGQLKVGQEASFTVDSFPGERFRGTVEQIRLNPKSVQNVVTYVVVVTADNPDLRLFPGMTANVTISVAHRDDAIKVPNAALRFRPQLRPDELIELRQQMQAAQKVALTPDQQMERSDCIRRQAQARAGRSRPLRRGFHRDRAGRHQGRRPGACRFGLARRRGRLWPTARRRVPRSLMGSVVVADGLTKTYRMGSELVHALVDVSLPSSAVPSSRSWGRRVPASRR